MGDDPRNLCIHQLIEAQAGRTPAAAAVCGASATLTYRELDGHAAALARHLRRLGVGPGVPVGVCLDRSPDMVAGLLGVLKGASVSLGNRRPWLACFRASSTASFLAIGSPPSRLIPPGGHP